MAQPHAHPLRSNPPAPPVRAKPELRIPQAETHPQPLPSKSQRQLFTRPQSLLFANPPILEPPPPFWDLSDSSSSSSSSTFSTLIVARCDLLRERSDDYRSVKIHSRIEESSGKLLKAPKPPTTLPETEELDTTYFLRSLSRNAQRARVGDPSRRRYLMPSLPAEMLKKKLKEQVVERRRLQRLEQARNNDRPRCTMNALRIMMINGNMRAREEYFQRLEEEKLARRERQTSNNKQRQESKPDLMDIDE